MKDQDDFIFFDDPHATDEIDRWVADDPARQMPKNTDRDQNEFNAEAAIQRLGCVLMAIFGIIFIVWWVFAK